MSRFAILGGRGYPSYYGGFETLVRHLAPHLVGEGHDVVVYGRTQGRRSLTKTIDGVEVRLTPTLDFKSTSTLSVGLTASRDLARDPCDAALILNVANGFYLRRLSRAGIATCVNVDGLEWDREKWGSVARAIFRHAAKVTARDADALIFDSKALSSIWQNQFGRSGQFIPYGAPVLNGYGTERLRELGLPHDGYVLAVARIVPENNVDLLLDALEHLPTSTRVIVVGGSNYDHATPRRLRELEAEGRIIWLGHVDDQELLNELWVNSGVYWHGHSVGGTNPALLQALGAGAPTIALDTPFNREVVERDAQLVPHDGAALAARISDVLGSPGLAESFRESGRATVRDRYSWEGVCGKYSDLLTGLAESNRRSITRIAASSQGAASDNGQASRASSTRLRLDGRAAVVVLVGPDGAGKSRLAIALQDALSARLGTPVPIVNFRSRYLDRALRRKTDSAAAARAADNPHETPMLGAAAASAKAIVLWADLVLSAADWRRRRDRRATLVERYAYDLVVDPARLGLTRAPRRLRELVVRFSPPPDIIVMCRAPAAVLRERKADLDEGEISRQYRVWRDLRTSIDVPFIDVDTTASVDAEQLTERILAALRR